MAAAAGVPPVPDREDSPMPNVPSLPKTVPWGHEWAGRIDELVFASDALRGNPLGDPAERPLWVYTPPGYDEDTERRYPTVYEIQGFTGSVPMWRNRVPWRPTFAEAMDAMFARGDSAPAIVVFVDAWTAYGGSQFLDSPGTGDYHTYLCDEVVPFVDARYRTLPDRDHRAIAGKSSGGFGAMVTPMLRPDLFGGFATHAGDALFDVCYVPMFGPAARALRDHYDGSYDAFWSDFSSRIPGAKPTDHELVEPWAYAAAYSAEPDGSVLLPFEPSTGRLVDDVWARWLAWDPVRMVPGHADALRSMRAIWIDAGTRDDWWLDLGAEAFRRALDDAGVHDCAFELFDATHALIEYRYHLAVGYLADRMSG
jgi:S-formylglutathione hydrolase FrmB